MIPQIDNQINTDLHTQVMLPSKTYKICNDVSTTQVKLGSPTTVKGNEINIEDCGYNKGILNAKINGAIYQYKRDYSEKVVEDTFIQVSPEHDENPSKLQLKGNSVQEGEPTPENPVAIQNVEGNIDITVCNKNLFNKNNANVLNAYISANKLVSESQNRIIWIPCKSNVTYTASKKAGQRFAIYFSENEPAIGVTISGGTSDNTASTLTSTSLSDSKYIVIYVANYNVGTEIPWQDILDSLQIEENPTATEYIENQQQAITFPLQEGQKLMKGDYLADDGIHKIKNQVIFDGTENWNLYIWQTAPHTETTIFTVANIITKKVDCIKFCNYFKVVANTGGNLNKDEEYCLNDIGGTVYFSISNNIASTVEEIKQWLAEQKANGTPVIVEYELAEEIIEPYTSEQQEAYNKLQNLKLYQPLTYIFTANDICNLKLIYDILQPMPTISNPSELVTINKLQIIQKGNIITNSYTYHLTDRLRAVNNGVCDILENDKIIRKVGYIESYTNEDVGDNWISSTGELSQGAAVVYELSSPHEESIDDPLLEFKPFFNKNNITIKANIETTGELELSYYPKSQVEFITTVTNRIIGYADGLEALKQAIYHILSTERYAYIIYDNNYGVEFEQYIGKDLEYIQATIEQTLKEALTYDLRITDVIVNAINKIDLNTVSINFTINSIYGNLVLEVNVNV